MPRTVADAELEVYAADNGTDSPDVVIPGDDIQRVKTKRRIGALKDTGSLDLSNTHGKYDRETLTTGDRLVWRTRLEGEASLSDRWTAIAGVPEHSFGAGTQRTISVSLTDFVFGVLDWRLVYNSFESTPISGSPDAILETLLSNKAPEIGQSQIQSVGTTANYFSSGTSLFEIVGDLQTLSDAVVYNDGRDLVFRPLGDITTQWQLQRGRNGDIRTGSVSGADDDLANVVRVDGGTSQAVDDEQTTQSNYTTVTTSSRLTHQLSTRKSEVDRIEVWTRTTGSGEQLTVRLQKDDGGAPVAPSDQQSDIVNKTLDSTFLADDGYTTFIFASHTLPESNPWVIIETDGSSGQEIGTDGSGAPAYRAYFPYPLDIRARAGGSIDEYRRREDRIRDDELETLAAAQDTAEAEVGKRGAPRLTISAPAHSVRAHNLTPGDAVDVDWPREGVQGPVVCTQVQETHSAGSNRLETTLTFEQQSTLRQT
ncbi:hypothetical protein [Halosimplex sp. J119]